MEVAISLWIAVAHAASAAARWAKASIDRRLISNEDGEAKLRDRVELLDVRSERLLQGRELLLPVLVPPWLAVDARHVVLMTLTRSLVYDQESL